MGSIKPDWLSQLAPAHAPPPPDMWPLAPGYWAVLILLLTVIAVVVYRYYRPVMRIRRTALRELNRLEQTAVNDNELARNLESLMRRYAVSRYGREQVANLAGSEWIRFVANHRGTAFAGEVGSEFLRAAWGKTVTGQRAVWIRGARDFIRSRS
jgi:hypothetical protein